jgi:hypothetical protein
MSTTATTQEALMGQVIPKQQQQQALPPGTRGPRVLGLTPGTRFDGGPDEGTRGPQSPTDGLKESAGGPRMIPQGPGGPR